MEKERPNRSSLPEEARQWLDAQRAEIVSGGLANNTRGKDAHAKIEGIASCLQLSAYSVRAFRDLHFLAHPRTSVAGLPVDDELFLSLIWADIYTIEELEQRLGGKELSAELFDAENNEHKEERLATIQAALIEWRRMNEAGRRESVRNSKKQKTR